LNAELLNQLPTVGAKNIAVRVVKSAEKPLRTHPWLFDRAIASQSHDGRAGDIAVVFDHKRRFLAAGLYDPASPIRIKLLQHNTPATIDCTYFHTKIEAAIERRSEIELQQFGQTDGYRLINGENDGLPALIVDRYADSIVLKLYSPIWFPHLRCVVDFFSSKYRCGRIVLRLSRRVQEGTTFGLSDGVTLYGTAPTAPILFHENGLTFETDIVKGQKTGHFLDQRDNRQRVRALTQGKEVLDVFASTGGFTVYAAAGGAKALTSIDLSAPTLAITKQNMAHNGLLATCNLQLLPEDAFAALARLHSEGKKYDVVIIDPPSFAQKQADIDNALAAYGRLTRLGLQVLKRGGIVVQSSCSSRVSAEQFFATVERVAGEIGRKLTQIEYTHHAADHPVNFREGAYLKCLFGRA
jgi:23S rRNA (cytosine1962-C5)-methyltransferase